MARAANLEKQIFVEPLSQSTLRSCFTEKGLRPDRVFGD